LLAIIGTRYGAEDGSTTFNLPDFRDSIPVGIDALKVRVNSATELGQTAGQVTQTLALAQLPAHTHGKGTLGVTISGVHNHFHTDPDHNHGGVTGSGPMGGDGRGTVVGGSSNDQATHTHVIATDTAHITIDNAGAHTHDLNGEMDSVGANQSFSLLNPYQVVQHIIYTGD